MSAILAPPAIPADARHLTADRWAYCDPGLADSPAWTRLLADLAAIVPALRSVSVQLGTTPPGLAGLTDVEVDGDGRAWITVTVAHDLDPIDAQRVVRHELGHCADVAARLMQLDEPSDIYASHAARPLGEAFAEHCETWLTVNTPASVLLDAARTWPSTPPVTVKETPMTTATSPARFRHQVDEAALRRVDLDDHASKLGPAGCLVELVERTTAVAGAGGTDEALLALFRHLRSVLPAADGGLPAAYAPAEQALQAAVLAAGGAVSVPVAQLRAVGVQRLDELGLAVMGKLPRSGDVIVYAPRAGQAGALVAEIAGGTPDGPVRRALEEKFNARRPEPVWAQLSGAEMLDEVQRLAGDVAAGNAKAEHVAYLTNGARLLARAVFAAAPLAEDLVPLPGPESPVPDGVLALVAKVRAGRGYIALPAGEVRRLLDGLPAGAVGLGLVPAALPDGERTPVAVHVTAGRVGQLLAALADGDTNTAETLADALRALLADPEPAVED